ncbi:MAG: protein arginine kinase [Candidatus Krumholzibacteriia bacterium]
MSDRRLFFTTCTQRCAPWLDGAGPDSDIVISTRLRLARNLVGHFFSHHASDQELRALREMVSDRLLDCPAFAGGCSLDLETLEPTERKCLLEMHLASPALIRVPEGRGLVVEPDCTRSVMINEEDHLRLQVFRAGFQPRETCSGALDLDREVESELEFAFSEELGYLTACPTNLGTGLRISVLIHLPGLVMAGEIEKILNSLRQLQFAVRGLFGEGSAVRGALFQVSNLVTLGRSEQQITEDFARHVSRVLEYERMAREQLISRNRVGVEDMVFRSIAILGQARLITTQEALDRLSHVRMGVSLGLVPRFDMKLLNRALVQQRSAHLQLRAGRKLDGRERTELRARYLRELLAE